MSQYTDPIRWFSWFLLSFLQHRLQEDAPHAKVLTQYTIDNSLVATAALFIDIYLFINGHK